MQYLGTPIQWPLAQNTIRRQSNSHTFGMVRTNSDGTPRPHQGWDFYANAGTPCYSIASGKVALITHTGDYGSMIVITIADTGMYAAYAHMETITLKEGDLVAIGDQIGTTGNSGSAASMKTVDQHLHFEIRTKPRTGKGLADRVSPLAVFGKIPLKTTYLIGDV